MVSKINTMENIVSSWGRRQLTMNGRMILAKTFLLSQIVFPAQFTLIQTKEVKKIERLIYSFVNGARNLYGPEHIARRYLKADRSHGGLNGVDVDSFLSALILRQFGKATSKSRNLKALQSSLTSTKDEISTAALARLKTGYIRMARSNPIPDLQVLANLSSIPLNSLLPCTSTGAAHASRQNLEDLFAVQTELQRGVIPRQRNSRSP